MRRLLRAPRRNRPLRRFRAEPLEARVVLSAVPAYSSLPGAAHTIFLDFDGHTVENTEWNNYYSQSSIVAQPYDIDGNPGVFSSTELSRITEAYHRVAEDFRPFNVNVTTVEPSADQLIKSGSGDTQWGVRLLVTRESTMINDPSRVTGAGGIAYIGSFNWGSDTPAWVFTTGGKSIAEAASHEAGHTLGLSHDGTSTSGYYTGHGSGDTGWASIMGVGYYENVTQWDDGTYFGSNNAGSGANYGLGPDDLAVITGYNGFGYRADDHGDTIATATPLTAVNGAVNTGGVIETSSDFDVYSFTTGAGSISFDAAPFTPGPNVDLQLDLLNAAGSVLVSSNPASLLGASIATTVAAGQYYLRVTGVGVGDPTSSTPTGYTDYASIGSYTIAGSVTDTQTVPTLAVGDVSVVESAGSARVSVTLNGTIEQNVTVAYRTVDGNAFAGSDYTSTSGVLTFTPGGSTVQTITVPIINDSVTEGNESFTVELFNASGAVIGDSSGTVSIADDDISVSIANASVTEGNPPKGKKNAGGESLRDMTFNVRLSSASTGSVTVPWSTSDGSATEADNDYKGASGTVTFAPGETLKTIAVSVVGDSTAEPDETFNVVLGAATGATVADGLAVGTIQDDDSGSSGGGPGKGNGNGKNIANPDSQPLMIIDPVWYFESVADHDHDHHDHDHDHEHGDHDHGHDEEHTADGSLFAHVSGRPSEVASRKALPAEPALARSAAPEALLLAFAKLHDADFDADELDESPWADEESAADESIRSDAFAYFADFEEV